MAKRKVKRKKVVRRRVKRTKAPAAKARSFNKAAYIKAYKALQGQVDKAWKKFCLDKKRKASKGVMAKDHQHLLLLLGECNYLARECMRMGPKRRR